jgi:hydrogenase maturation factor
MSGCHPPFIIGIKRVSLSALLKVCSLSYQQFGHLFEEEQKDGNWSRIIVHMGCLFNIFSTLS